MPDCDNMWVFDKSFKPQIKASNENKKQIRNVSSSSQNLMSHDASSSSRNEPASELGQQADEHMQAEKHAEPQTNPVVDNMDTIDSKFDEESDLATPQFNFRFYLKG